MYRLPDMPYYIYIPNELTNMTNTTFTAPTLPTRKATTKKARWTPNTATKLALTLLILV